MYKHYREPHGFPACTGADHFHFTVTGLASPGIHVFVITCLM